MNDLNSNDSVMNIIAQAISKMKSEQGEDFSYANVNLAELSRLSGLSRQRLRTLQSHGFKELPHGNKGRIAASSVLDGYTDQLNELLKAGITNSCGAVCCMGRGTRAPS